MLSLVSIERIFCPVTCFTNGRKNPPEHEHVNLKTKTYYTMSTEEGLSRLNHMK